MLTNLNKFINSILITFYNFYIIEFKSSKLLGSEYLSINNCID